PSWPTSCAWPAPTRRWRSGGSEGQGSRLPRAARSGRVAGAGRAGSGGRQRLQGGGDPRELRLRGRQPVLHRGDDVVGRLGEEVLVGELGPATGRLLLRRRPVPLQPGPLRGYV